MTHPVETSEIKRMYDSGQSMAEISRLLNISIETVRYRLKKAGYTPRQRRKNVTKQSVRILREHMPTLVAIKQFMEADRRELLAKIEKTPSPKAVDRLGSLNDFIMSLSEVTA